MEVSDQLHAPATFPQGKQPPVPIRQEDGWAPELVLTLWTRGRSLASSGNQTPVSQLSKTPKYFLWLYSTNVKKCTMLQTYQS
jgi:hypothetical protein